MSHVTLYRKYRSQSFSDLVGQGHVVRSLQNALARGKHVQAYLFTGPRGTGKTSTARLLAKSLNCENGPTPEPCNACGTCESITSGSCFDVIELDAASESGVDDVREKIVEVAEYPPSFCRYRVIILDEVHDLSGKAFDALLKTVEEPPAHLVFILATTEFQKVPPTIRSRCQKFEFHRGSIQEIAARIKHVADAENISIEPAAISALARMADGGFRDALTLLEQASLLSEGPITLAQVFDQLGLIEEGAIDRLLLAISRGDTQGVMDELDAMTGLGRDATLILESTMYRLSDLTRAAFGTVESPDGATAAAMHETAARIGAETLVTLRSLIAEAHRGIKAVSLPRIWLEAEMLGISRRLATAEHQAPSVVRETPPIARAETVATSRQAPSDQRVQSPSRSIPAADGSKPNPIAAPSRNVELPSQDPTGDPELDRVLEVWKQAVKLMYGPGGSPNLATKLVRTRVLGVENERVTIAFDRNVDFNSVTGGENGPKKRGLVAEKFAAAGGNGWTIEYVVQASESEPAPIEAAVELPSEGKRLHELAKEVFPGT